MSTKRHHLRAAAGIAGQLAGTAVLGIAVIHLIRLGGLPGQPAAWVAASLLFLLAVIATGLMMREHYPHDRIGACNVVTLLRAALVCALLPPLLAGEAAGWLVAGIGALSLSLDGADGWLARHSGLASDFGARLDMEVDALLALLLALHILLGTVIGAEILLLGLLRPGFVAAGWLLPWLRESLPPRFRRKLICVVQLSVLVILQVPLLPADTAIWLARAAAVALVWSFAADMVWLWRQRP
ncbi:CDP-alcohol phosphatidyltransferase family protein [Paracoccus salsus]|uniref:CDP-alcohol phosphatidyltransferase family protein n=1 Tax=Paracoccus salsus TaxID=2911061 RepID=UPI001F3DCE57|nr:CDP-alcohol phosphatidyltransferase family protein [Paracoccus salsus]